MWRIRDEQAGDEEAIFAVHAAAFPTPAEARLVDALGLAPVAVLPAEQRRGTGGALGRAGLERCRSAGVPFVVVLGEPADYGRFGFVPASRFALVDEYGGDDAFMVQATSSGGLDGVRGLVRYGLEFTAL